MDTQIAVLLFCIALAIRAWRRRFQSLPPGPPTGFLGDHRLQVPDFEPYKKFAECRDHAADNDELLVLQNYQTATDLLDKRGEIYSSRPRSIVGQEILADNMRILGMAYGDKWRKMRKVQYSGLNEKYAINYREFQSLESAVLIEELCQNPSLFSVHFQRFATSVVFAISYGKRVLSMDDPVVKDSRVAANAFASTLIPGRYIVESWPFLLWLPVRLTFCTTTALQRSLQWFRWAQEKRKQLDIKLYVGLFREVKCQTDDGMAKSSMSLQMCQDQSLADMSEVELAYSAAGPFTAGIGTVSSALDVFVLAMILHPECLRRAQEELDIIVGTSRMPTFADEDSLPYVRALIKETLRWRVIAPTAAAHSTTADDVYKGYRIPKGATVYGNLYSICHDHMVFTDPANFMPERFLETKDPRITNFELPYGFGRRICPGRHVANQSLFIVISRMLWSFNFALHTDASGKEILPDPDAFTSGLILSEFYRLKLLNVRFLSRNGSEGARQIVALTTRAQVPPLWPFVLLVNIHVAGNCGRYDTMSSFDPLQPSQAPSEAPVNALPLPFTPKPVILEEMETELDRYAREIPLDTFVRAFLGVAPDKWAASFEPLKKCDSITRALSYYSVVARGCHAPAAAMGLLNAIREEAAKLLGVTYPVGDMGFGFTHPNNIFEDLENHRPRLADVYATRKPNETYRHEEILLPIQIEIVEPELYPSLYFLTPESRVLYEKWDALCDRWASAETCAESTGEASSIDRNLQTSSAGDGRESSAIGDSSAKPSFYRKDKSPMAQLITQQATDILSASRGSRQHAFGMVLRGENAQLWYYDPVGILHTPQEFSILDNFTTFASIIFAFCSLTECQWGHLEIVHSYMMDRGSQVPAPLFPHKGLTGALVKFKDGRVYCVQDRIHSEHSNIAGRRTQVYYVRLWDRQDEFDHHIPKRLVLKLSYPPCHQEKEWSFIQDANRAGIEHVPEVFSCDEFFRISQRSRSDVSFLQPGQDYGDRAFRAIIFPKYVAAFDRITPRNYISILIQLANSLYQLHKIGVLHCDISVKNIMVDPRRKDQTWVIVNDFDMATRTEVDGAALPSMGVGTPQFMGYELLRTESTRHRLRHDLESLFYVALWWARMDISREDRGTLLALWVEANSDADICLFKEALLRSARVSDMVPLWKGFGRFAGQLDMLKNLFREANWMLLGSTSRCAQNLIVDDAVFAGTFMTMLASG
ncbi:hypothetical protein EVG20_g7888 [Dentipellis fragilis]|uniref:Fungal-type protein kinase domain-containing protein n=1 Tax=Dentipellis fragilis TaxID=205917 RepID=A0A4Y9YBR0_9AGAM|nr:hypothetical protein EVG20_g7888 [Dentipellis fragilis]